MCNLLIEYKLSFNNKFTNNNVVSGFIEFQQFIYWNSIEPDTTFLPETSLIGYALYNSVYWIICSISNITLITSSQGCVTC